jgi:cytochrome c-type biogenesis protein
MFGLEIMDAGLLSAMAIALAAGTLSFLSPCVLPIVPPYLAYMGGITLDEVAREPGRRRGGKALLAALFFVLGLSTVFIFLGFTASIFGQFFLQNQILLGRSRGRSSSCSVCISWASSIPILNREARLDAGDRGGSALGAYILGPGLCVRLDALHRPAAGRDPVAGRDRGERRSAAPRCWGSMRSGLASRSCWRRRSSTGDGGDGAAEAAHADDRAGHGLLLVAVGGALITGAFSAFAFWLLETFPALALLG